MRETSRGQDKKLDVKHDQKTEMIKQLAKILDVPLAITDATTLTENGRQ